MDFPLVLDLDLDFFLEDRPTYSERGRPRNNLPWREADFCTFLEDRCGLSASDPVPGCVFKSHDTAFTVWRDLLVPQLGSAPFRVVHVDAHADLGSSIYYKRAVLEYLSGTILPLRPDLRGNPARSPGSLWETNYLLFAVACRWIAGITYVTRPDWNHRDFPKFFVRTDEHGDYVELVEFAPSAFRPGTRFRFDSAERLSVEPRVRIETVSGEEFVAPGHFQFASLAVSPNYTPREADVLARCFARYVRTI